MCLWYSCVLSCCEKKVWEGYFTTWYDQLKEIYCLYINLLTKLNFRCTIWSWVYLLLALILVEFLWYISFIFDIYINFLSAFCLLSLLFSLYSYTQTSLKVIVLFILSILKTIRISYAIVFLLFKPVYNTKINLYFKDFWYTALSIGSFKLLFAMIANNNLNNYNNLNNLNNFLLKKKLYVNIGVRLISLSHWTVIWKVYYNNYTRDIIITFSRSLMLFNLYRATA